MGSLNRVILIGHLGADPDLRYTAGGVPVANMRIATSETWNDAEGKRQERTEWHRIVVWGKSAEACDRFLRKGRAVSVEGRLQTREWTDQNGLTRYTTEIVASNVVFLGSNQGGARPSAHPSNPSPSSTDRAEPAPSYGGYGYGTPQGQADGGYNSPAMQALAGGGSGHV